MAMCAQGSLEVSFGSGFISADEVGPPAHHLIPHLQRLRQLSALSLIR